MRLPVDVPTQETATFIAAHVRAGARLLEIGCGEGQLARELASRGYRVVGIDSDPVAVASARERGVEAVVAAWPDFECTPMDAVAFTRSLHHMGPIDAAVRRAREVVKRGGAVLVEDFAFDGADERTIEWFLQVLRSPRGRALVAPVPGAFVTDLLSASDPIAAWHQSHDHELHTVETMRLSLQQELVLGEAGAAPYIYRYLVPVLPPSADGAAFIEAVLKEEARRGARGEIVLIGRRMAGAPRDPHP